MNTVRVVVVDDHALVREGVRRVLDAVDDIDVVGEASTGQEARECIRDLKPDVLVLDITLPDTSGLAIAEEVPSLCATTRVLILSMHRHGAYVERAIEAGACGYVLKDSPPHQLRDAVRMVSSGGKVFDPDVVSDAGDERLDRLTPRERDVLIAIAEGLSNKDIAARFQISPRTVESHRESLMRKTGIHNVAGLTRFALRLGLIPESPPDESSP